MNNFLRSVGFGKKRNTEPVESDSLREVIIHAHIFKNGGTTLDHILKKNFDEQCHIDHEDNKLIHEKQKYLEQVLTDQKRLKAFSSHSIHFTPKNSNLFRFHTIYFLRHPIERIKSVYEFELKQDAEQSLGAKKAHELDFRSYIKWYMADGSPGTIRNCQTIFLSGMGPSVTQMEKKFEAASEKLDHLMVGIVDRYDESLYAFSSVLEPFFGKLDLSYQKKNVREKSSALSMEEKIQAVESELGEALTQEVIEKNKYDLELYAEANRRLDKLLLELKSSDEISFEIE